MLLWRHGPRAPCHTALACMVELDAFETPAAPRRTLDPLAQPVHLAMETSLQEVGATARHCEETALAWQRGPGSRQTARWIVRIGCSRKVDPANHKFRHTVTKSSWRGSKSGRPRGRVALKLWIPGKVRQGLARCPELPVFNRPLIVHH